MIKIHGNKGKHHTEEARRKISIGHKGKKMSKETKQKISNAHMGRTISEETKIKIGQANKGKTSWSKGKTFSLETREKMSLSMRGIPRPSNRGENNNSWKGGITPINKQIRHSLEYKIWRMAVFTRDNWTYIWCGQIGGKLHADHIKPFALYPELRFAIDNGRTLCVDFHKTTETWGGRKNG